MPPSAPTPCPCGSLASPRSQSGSSRQSPAPKGDANVEGARTRKGSTEDATAAARRQPGTRGAAPRRPGGRGGPRGQASSRTFLAAPGPEAGVSQSLRPRRRGPWTEARFEPGCARQRRLCNRGRVRARRPCPPRAPLRPRRARRSLQGGLAADESVPRRCRSRCLGSVAEAEILAQTAHFELKHNEKLDSTFYLGSESPPRYKLPHRTPLE